MLSVLIPLNQGLFLNPNEMVSMANFLSVLIPLNQGLFLNASVNG